MTGASLGNRDRLGVGDAGEGVMGTGLSNEMEGDDRHVCGRDGGPAEAPT